MAITIDDFFVGNDERRLTRLTCPRSIRFDKKVGTTDERERNELSCHAVATDLQLIFFAIKFIDKQTQRQYDILHPAEVEKAGEGNEIDHRHKHLDLLSSITSDVDGSNYYCECPPGFIGHDCSVEVKECTSHRADLVHSCYFGSECIEADNEYGLLDKFCDCSRAHSEDGAFVAGLMCQYTSSTICVDDDKAFASTTDAFCTNGGTCQRIVGSDEDFPGCQCEEGTWDGKHCEFANG
eukprot:scaffold18593_cov76-Skeletonema_dohrnii-CCMP3373.AAC.1